jgi:hypothetical protein
MTTKKGCCRLRGTAIAGISNLSTSYARARQTSSQHLLNRGDRSSLPTYFEIINRRIATLSERKTDPLHKYGPRFY